MAHVQPHRWADAQAGRVSASAMRELEQHAAACAQCAAQRDRVRRASAAFAEIREAEPPALGWDHIGARIYWVTSSERRGRPAARRRWSLALIPAAVAAVAVAGWLIIGHLSDTPTVADQTAPDTSPERADPVAQDPVAPKVAPKVAPIPPEPLRGVVTFLQGEVTNAGEPVAFDARIERGARLDTRAGRVAVQFQKGSGFMLAETSSLTVERFDERGVVLRVEGEVLVDLTRRDPGQTFVVRAGDREVSVRGTIFRVTHRDRSLRVSCSHGKVVVADEQHQIDVSAGQELWFEHGGVIRETDLLPADFEFMKHAVPHVKAWGNAATLLRTSSTLAVRASQDSPVKIDGIVRGTGAFRLRVMPGRHLVAGDGSDGSWVDVDEGATLTARVKSRASRSGKSVESAGKAKRRSQLIEALRRGVRVQACMLPVRKQGIDEGAFIVVDLGINKSGVITHNNIVNSNLPSAAEACIRDALDDIKFPAGPAVTLTQQIAL